MFGTLLSLVVALQAPKSFEEIEVAKIIDFHDLKRLHFEIEAELGGKTIRTTLYREGKKNRTVISLPDGSKIDSIDDGKTTWYLLHAQKTYWVQQDPAESTFFARGNLLQAAASSFNMNLMGMGPIQFASDPPLKVVSMQTVNEGGETLRKLVAGTTSKKGRHLTVTQWILPNKWIVKKAQIVGTSENGPVSATVRLATVDFSPTIPPGEFTFNSSMVAGYQKAEGAPPIFH